MNIGYPLRFAIESLKREFWINLIAGLSAGIGLFIIAIILLGVYNINLLTKRLPERFTIVIYLKDQISGDEINSTISELKNNPLVASVRFIPKEHALNELKKRLKDSSFLIEGLDENPLPDSIEVKLKPQFVNPAALKGFVSGLRSMGSIEDIDYGENIMASIVLIKKVVENAGIALSSIILIGVVFNFYTTIKILFYRRREEIETFKLLGASRGFIRAPFLIEGFLLGISGGLIGAILTSGIYESVMMLSSNIPFLANLDLWPSGISVIFVGLCGGGGFLGMLGAFISLGRIRY